MMKFIRNIILSLGKLYVALPFPMYVSVFLTLGLPILLILWLFF